MNTAKFVKQARATLDLTQAELAEKLGLERRSILRYEGGADLPLRVHLALQHLVGIKQAKKKTPTRSRKNR